jgi:hypothetical protein
METYNTNTSNYEVFGANMTVDTQSEVYSTGALAACKSCQCNCRLCIGGKLPEDAEVLGKVEVENALEKLLAA